MDRSAEIETLLRSREDLRQRLLELSCNRDQGGHTIGEIWQRQRLSCLSRKQLGSYLLEIHPHPIQDYIHFHLYEIGCRFCLANLDDLKATQQAGQQQRQQRYFESSAGLLRSFRSERETD